MKTCRHLIRVAQCDLVATSNIEAITVFINAKGRIDLTYHLASISINRSNCINQSVHDLKCALPGCPRIKKYFFFHISRTNCGDNSLSPLSFIYSVRRASTHLKRKGKRNQ